MRSAHQDTLLGNVWHLANPMLSVAVYYLVFGVMLDVSRGIDNYVLWLMIGVFTFNLTSRCVLGGATAISNNQGLMRAIRFPRALLPVSVIVQRLLTFGFELAVLAAVALLTGEGVTWRWLALPIVIGVHSALNLGGAFYRRPAQRQLPRHPADHPVPVPPVDVPVRGDVPARPIPDVRQDR